MGLRQASLRLSSSSATSCQNCCCERDSHLFQKLSRRSHPPWPRLFAPPRLFLPLAAEGGWLLVLEEATAARSGSAGHAGTDEGPAARGRSSAHEGQPRRAARMPLVLRYGSRWTPPGRWKSWSFLSLFLA